jgi:hypothetical protein
MRRTTPLAGLLVLVVLAVSPALLASSAVKAAPPPELKKLHVLMVIDTSSDLVDSLKIDTRRMTQLLETHIPADRCTRTVLHGKDATSEKILDHYARLRVSPSEGLLFFYAGHGATDDKVGHCLLLANGKPLVRSELRRAMEAKNAGLVVLLTDCCSTRVKLGMPPPIWSRSYPTTTLAPTFRCLFYQARGTVDITAATDNASWCDDNEGGIFTRSLAEILDRPVKNLDSNGDGFVTWAEFFPQLRKQTEEKFTDWSERMRGRGETINAARQTPKAFALERTTAVKQAVVSLENQSEQKLRYRVRWSASGEWSAWNEIRPAAREVVSTPVSDSTREAPIMHIQFEGLGTGKLRSRLWTGTGKPSLTDGEAARVRFGRRAE